MEIVNRYVWATRFPPYLPLRGGDFVYTSKLVESLAAEAPVDVICFDHGGEQPQGTPTLRWHILPWQDRSKWRSVFNPLPHISYNFRSIEFMDRLISLSEGATAIFVDHVSMAWVVQGLRSHKDRAGRGPATIIVSHNYEAQLRRDMCSLVSNPILRTALRWDAWKAARIEAKSIDRADGATAITEADRREFQKDHPERSLLTIEPGYDGPIVGSRLISVETPVRCCILASRTSYHKRLIFKQATEALMRLPTEKAVKIDVIGVAPGEDAREILYLPDHISILGFVDDLPAYLQTVRLGIMLDVIGGGFKLRALALAFNRVPMMAVAGALSGMGLVPGRDYLEYPDIEALISALPRVVNDVTLLNALQTQAMETVRSRYEWGDRARALIRFASDLSQRSPSQ